MSKSWVTGCPHFGHDNIRKLCNRPFPTIHEMHRVITDNWNAVVKPEDTVYVLGDFTFRAPHPGWQYAKNLNGNKILVWGNHDSNRVSYELHGILVHDRLELEVLGTRVILDHYPIEEWDGWFKGSVHLHAHCHGNRPNAIRRYDVSVDANNFTPLDLEYVVAQLKTEQVFDRGALSHGQYVCDEPAE
jgi:calcineurin-like phosphoesterase family protein